MPFALNTSQMPSERKMVMTMVMRRSFRFIRSLTTAHATNAMLTTGREYIVNIMPCIAVDIDLCRNWATIKNVMIIIMGAPHRSIPRALLKNIHQINTASPPMIPLKTAYIRAPGTISGKTYLKVHCNTTITIPGQILSDLNFKFICPVNEIRRMRNLKMFRQNTKKNIMVLKIYDFIGLFNGTHASMAGALWQ